ncbi:MAG TPA: TraB/GumN family protein [Steroidobacteraceae bacterium]|nr:TraB/GumN family protein [Steroidobacteraceae bacterium]
MRRPFMRRRLLGLALCCAAFSALVRADAPLHALWELHGKHNTVYLLGSIHVLRPTDYPLSPAVLNAYRDAKSIFMEVNLAEIDSQRMQTELLASARLPEGQTLLSIMGEQRYKRAQVLAQEVGIDLGIFDAFAPWFAAEAISQLQLQQLGFQPQSGVEMFFLERARSDGKSVAGLETVHDQIALFDALSMDEQADYLVSSLEEAHDLPKEVAAMVHAWVSGDTQWFADQIKSEIGRDPALYQSVLVARNRKWVPKIEALLNDDRNYLVIVGTGHLVGQGSVIELLRKDGIVAAQR